MHLVLDRVKEQTRMHLLGTLQLNGLTISVTSVLPITVLKIEVTLNRSAQRFFTTK